MGHHESVDDAIRALVRREIGIPAPASQSLASRGDAFMLALLTLNLALLLSYFPNQKTTDEFQHGWLSVFTDKGIPWLASTLCVAGYTWWTENVLWFVRLKGFRLLNVGLAAVLILAQVPLIPLHVRLAPQESELWVDETKIKRSAGHWDSNDIYEYDLNVRFGPHDFTIKPPHTWKVADPDMMEQTFHLGWKGVVRALISAPTQQLSLVWPVTVMTPRGAGEVTINRISTQTKDGKTNVENVPFATEFLDNPLIRREGLRPVGLAMRVTSLGEEDAKLIHLPAGRYRAVTAHGKCACELTIAEDNRQPNFQLDLLQCQ